MQVFGWQGLGGCPGGGLDHPRAPQTTSRAHAWRPGGAGFEEVAKALGKEASLLAVARGSSTKHQLLDSPRAHPAVSPVNKAQLRPSRYYQWHPATALVQKSCVRSAEQTRGRPAHRLLRARSCLAAADTPGHPVRADQHPSTKRCAPQKLKLANLLKRPHYMR